MKNFSKEMSLELKGIAIVMMIFHHCFRITNIFSGYSVSFFPFSGSQIVNLAYASKICVSIFAFISGYGLYLSYDAKNGSAQKWAFTRYLKSFAGYWFIWFCSAVICQLIDGRTYKTFFKEGFYQGVLYSIISFFGLDSIFKTPALNAIWWYMGAVIVFLLLTPLIYKCKNEMLLVLVAFIVLPREFLGVSGVVKASGTKAFSFLIPFLMGSIFARYRLFDKLAESNSIQVRVYRLICEVWMIIFLYKMYHHLDRGLYWEVHYAALPMVFILFLVEFILPIRVMQKPLLFLGKHSMNMYLVHAFLLSYLKPIIFSNRHFIASTLILIVMSLAVSIIVETLKKLTRYNSLFTSF